MVIDYILDRKDGYGYDVKEFYDACMAYEEFDIARALDSGTEKDVKKALCDYVIYNDYPKSICKYINSENWLDDDFYESKKSARKSIKESKVDFQSVINRVLPKEYAKNKNAYRYALSCVTSLYNEDEYDSDSAKVYFLNCYISDLFPSWVDELGEEEIDAFVNALYDGTMKWSDIDSSWFESKKSARKSLKEYLVKGLDVDFVVDHLLSLEDLDNFDLINKLSDLWEVYNKSWNKFSKSLSDFLKVMKDIEKLDSFDKTCKEIIDAWYDDIEKIFYSDDNLENLKLNFGFEGNDVFESLEEDI